MNRKELLKYILKKSDQFIDDGAGEGERNVKRNTEDYFVENLAQTLTKFWIIYKKNFEANVEILKKLVKNSRATWE